MASTSEDFNGWSPNIGFDLGLRLSERLSVSLGVKRYNLVLKSDFVMPDERVTHINIERVGYTSIGYYRVFNIDNAMASKSFTTVDYLREFSRTKVKVRFVEIPINVGYNFQWKKWNATVHGGFNAAFVLSNEVQVGDDYDYYLFGEIQDLRENIFGASAGIDIFYYSKSKLTFGLKTDFIYYLNDINYSPEFNYHPYSFLISPQIGFRF
jgi:hypothetical protein